MDTFWGVMAMVAGVAIIVVFLVGAGLMVADLIRNAEDSGWMRGVWVVALIVLPFLAVPVYLIIHRTGMRERKRRPVEMVSEDDDYRASMGPTAPTDRPN